MFKYIKTIGGRSSVPEILTMPINTEEYHTAHTIGFLRNGVLNTTRETYVEPLYALIETVKPHTKSTIKCFRITEDMLFETGFGRVDYEILIPGESFGIESNSWIDYSSGGEVCLEQSNEAMTRDKVVIRFKTHF